MKAIPLMRRRCRGARTSGSRGARRRRRFSTLLPTLLVPSLTLRVFPTTLGCVLGLAVLVLVLFPRLFCFPLRLDARDLLLAHRRRLLLGTRIDELGGEAGVGEVRLARVEKVDRVGGGEAGRRRFGADVACAGRCGGLSAL